MNVRPIRGNGSPRGRRPARPPRVTKGAIDKIRERIVSGAWGPGDRLPKESELAAQLGLSRNSPRQALRTLPQLPATAGRQPGCTYASRPDPDLLLAHPAL